MTSAPSAAWGLAAGLCLDAGLGDPCRGHPVAAFGRLAAAAELPLYRDSRAAGTAYAAGLVGLAAGAGAAADRLVRRWPVGRLLLTAMLTWAVVGGTSLRRESAAMHRLLAADDLPASRLRIRSLCGRDPAALDAAELCRATVESVAENTSDAVVGALVWGAVAGLPGLVGYRALNTLDAMVGHHSPRYARFGWAAARADDVANLLPSRLTAALCVLLAPVVGGHPSEVLRVWRRDGRRHPSPNAGPVEAAFAGALGRTLGGPLSYGGRVELRPRLGDGPEPDSFDIVRAARLSHAVTLAAGAVTVGAALALERAVPLALDRAAR